MSFPAFKSLTESKLKPVIRRLKLLDGQILHLNLFFEDVDFSRKLNELVSERLQEFEIHIFL